LFILLLLLLLLLLLVAVVVVVVVAAIVVKVLECMKFIVKINLLVTGKNNLKKLRAKVKFVRTRKTNCASNLVFPEFL
jgi:hypothetical protein